MSEFALWTVVDGTARLTAGACESCRRISFPVSRVCRFCGSEQILARNLSEYAVVEAMTRMDDTLLVHVRTEEGVRVLGRAEPLDAISIGTRVRFEPSRSLVRFIAHA